MEAKVRQFLLGEETISREMGLRNEVIQESISRLEGELRRLERKFSENINAESELVSLRIRGKVSDDVYARQQSMLLAERQWIAEEKERVSSKLAQLRKKSSSLASLEELRKQLADKLDSKDFADRRRVLEMLNTRVIVTTEGAIEIEFLVSDGKPDERGIATSNPRAACPRFYLHLARFPFSYFP
ncbi:MAG: hypothetical protein N2506_07450 [Dehalococcoidales bacterium]|nr:hypothetical protein [Dehalococcoidales bacterium]